MKWFLLHQCKNIQYSTIQKIYNRNGKIGEIFCGKVFSNLDRSIKCIWDLKEDVAFARRTLKVNCICLIIIDCF